jgi:uncharacterized protein
MNRIKKIAMPVLFAGATLFAVVLVAVLANADAPARANAQGATPTPVPSALRSDIAVSSTGRVYVAPDTGYASIGVQVTAPTLEAATKQVDDKMTAVVVAIKAQGIPEKDIQTTSYNVYPITNQPKEGETSKITGYQVSNIVTVKMPIGSVSKVLDAALTAGANSINSVYFTLGDPTKAENDARTQAVKNATAQAQTLADAAGVKLGKVTSISDVSGGVVPIYRTVEFAQAAPANSAGPVETGQNEISVTVEMHFDIAE